MTTEQQERPKTRRPVRAPKSSKSRASVRGRQARLYVTHIEPWSAAKAAFMLAVTLAIVIIVAVAVVWTVLSVTGVIEALARNLDDVIGNANTAFDLRTLVSFQRVMGVTILVSAVEIVLVSALGSLFAYLYNLTVDITGGVEVTLSDDVQG